MQLRCCWFFVLALTLAGCDRPPVEPAKPDAGAISNAAAPAEPPRTGWAHLDHAQPELRTMTLWLGAEELSAEIALTTTEIATGMMFRKSMPEKEAMLFVFAQPHQAGFYMRNTTVPLSVAYIDPEGAIVEIYDLQPLDENSVTAKSDQIQYVLEVSQGWFDRHKIGVGTVLRGPNGSLPELFFPRKLGK